jgi:5-formyltetrahydrofolate cyclo-ligase
VHGVCVNTVQACALRAASRARVGESVTLRPEVSGTALGGSLRERGPRAVEKRKKIMAEKAAMRKAVRSSLRALSASAIAAASERACARAAALTADATSVCCYLAMPKAECLTTPLLDELFASSKRVYVPRVEGDAREQMRMLHVADAAALSQFPRSKWGIPEPTDEQCLTMEDGALSAAIDVVIVPGVAFDASCRRLGQGRGYYDTFLEKLSLARAARGLPPAKTVGLGLQEQLVDAVPVDAHDVPLDYVCLPDALFTRAAMPDAAADAQPAALAEVPPAEPPAPPAPAPAASAAMRSLRPRPAKETTNDSSPAAHPVHGVDTGLLPEARMRRSDPIGRLARSGGCC